MIEAFLKFISGNLWLSLGIGAVLIVFVGTVTGTLC